MFDPTSRYYKIDTATLDTVDAAGQARTIRYLRRRFLPPLSDAVTLVAMAVASAQAAS